jgi:hypothetical protein
VTRSDDPDLIAEIIHQEVMRRISGVPFLDRGGHASEIADAIAGDSSARLSLARLRPRAADRDGISRLAIDLVRDRVRDQHLGSEATTRAIVDLVVDEIEDSGVLIASVMSSIARRSSIGSPASVARAALVDRLVAETRADDAAMSPAPWRLSLDVLFPEIFSEPNDATFRDRTRMAASCGDPILSDLVSPTVFLVPTEDDDLSTRQGLADAAGAIRLRGNAAELANQLEVASMELEISAMEIESLTWRLSRALAERDAALAAVAASAADPREAASSADAAPAGCAHARTRRGGDVPRVYGSFRSQVCVDCGAFRTHGHGEDPDNPRMTHASGWRPACEYDDAISEPEES